MAPIYTSIIIVLSIAGTFLSLYIFLKKRLRLPLICPLHGSCDVVINSEYSKIFGIPIEFLGILYYGAVASSYSLLWTTHFPSLIPSLILVNASALAFLFSLYLTGLQIWVIKHWCTWCLFSAGFCTTIFITSLLKLFL
ncbi:vitamin K epoxide reductase family protein [Candidatus Wolfebacteria bacterium]|nr:vitamin K epoxide reductase family protein [Candidatus Wolfebacteria bacterium]